MPPASAALRRVAAITALVAGCERAGADPAFVPPGTLIAVQVQATDRATALSATTVTVRVRHDGDPTPYLTLTRALGAERLREPGVLPHLFPGVRGVQTPITVEATLTRDEGPPVVQLARVRFTPGFATKLVMDLNAACVAAPPCPGDQTCGGEGRCVPVLRDPLPLLEGGAPPGFDASLAPADASRDDLATPAGDGPSPCEGGPCAPLRLAGIAAGDATTCAWSEGGDVWCWGARVWGDGAPASRPPPSASSRGPPRSRWPAPSAPPCATGRCAARRRARSPWGSSACAACARCASVGPTPARASTTAPCAARATTATGSAARASRSRRSPSPPWRALPPPTPSRSAAT
ncbi:MAG: RCC1 domain-containing protein [Polyangiales bacterium]